MRFTQHHRLVATCLLSLVTASAHARTVFLWVHNQTNVPIKVREGVFHRHSHVVAPGHDHMAFMFSGVVSNLKLSSQQPTGGFALIPRCFHHRYFHRSTRIDVVGNAPQPLTCQAQEVN